PVAQWNNGKKEEFIQRKLFDMEKVLPRDERINNQIFKIDAAHHSNPVGGQPAEKIIEKASSSC
ncbi:MAG: hypothetical protein JXM72_12930, partial [Deltaproteobacteria bacterium]|nr:hypothetical protein [Deltaproteobacteria bacterium]